MCLLRLFRKFPDIVQAKEWSQEIVAVLDDQNLGVVNCAAALITALSQTYPDYYSGAVTKAIMKLNSVIEDSLITLLDCCERRI